MALPRSLSDLMQQDAVFRSLGTKSARQDLRNKQAKMASDLDGVGTPEPVYQTGPEELDAESVRIYEGVDPAHKELEKLRGEQREYAISQRKGKGLYTEAEKEADNARYQRDAKRKRIGAKADNFSEALARSAYVMKSRAMDEGGRVEPVMGGNSLPEPETMSGGGLVDDGQIGPDYKDARSEDQRMRTEYNQLQDAFISRGYKSMNPDGTPMSFRQYVGASMQDRPDSVLARGYAEGRADKLFAPSKDRFDDMYTADEARKSQFRADAAETRRRAMQAAKDGGIGVISDFQRQYDDALESLQIKQQQGSDTEDDLSALATAADRLAGGYMVAHSLMPNRGYDQMAATMMIQGNRKNSLAVRYEETLMTNESMLNQAAAQNPPVAPPPTAEEQLQGAIRSPVRSLEEEQLAMPLAGENPTEETKASAILSVRTATAELEASDVARSLATSGQIVQPGSADFSAMARYASMVNEQQFIQRLLPEMDDTSADPATRSAKQKRDNNYLLQLYRSARPQKIGYLKGIGNAIGGFAESMIQPSNPPPPSER